MAVNHIVHKISNLKQIDLPWFNDGVFAEGGAIVNLDPDSDSGKVYEKLFPKDSTKLTHIYASIMDLFPEYEEKIAAYDGYPEGWDNKTYHIGKNNSIPCIVDMDGVDLKSLMIDIFLPLFNYYPFISLLKKSSLYSEFYSLPSRIKLPEDVSTYPLSWNDLSRMAIALTAFATSYKYEG